MKNQNDLTVVIVTFQTPEKIILDCLRSINKDVNIIIVENSETFSHEEAVNSEFFNVKIVCTGKNLGYGKGNNFGLKQVKTDYALILNPDVICSENLFEKIPEVVNNIKNFAIIGFQYSYDKIFMPAGFFDEKKNSQFIENFKNDKINTISSVEWVRGCSMLLNLREFKDIEIFDKNFFLYFEEFDLCKSLINSGKNIFIAKELKIHHLGFKSSIGDKKNDNSKMIKLKDWHYMWSSFYFYRKNYGYIYALKKFIGKFLSSLFKMILYSILFQKINRDKYLYRFLGLLNSMLGKSSNYRG